MFSIGTDAFRRRLMGRSTACLGVVTPVDASFVVMQVTQWAQFSQRSHECQQPAACGGKAGRPERAPVVARGPSLRRLNLQKTNGLARSAVVALASLLFPPSRASFCSKAVPGTQRSGPFSFGVICWSP
jgi:hypothetical protein